MRSFVLVSLFRVLVRATCASTSLTSAVAHEAHQMECNETTINAMNADVQSMDDGNAKTTAVLPENSIRPDSHRKAESSHH